MKEPTLEQLVLGILIYWCANGLMQEENMLKLTREILTAHTAQQSESVPAGYRCMTCGRPFSKCVCDQQKAEEEE